MAQSTLFKDVAKGLLAAIAASTLASPPLIIIDVSVVKVAATGGRTTLLQAVSEELLAWLKSPIFKLRSVAFRLAWMVLIVMYGTANTVKAICDQTGTSPVVPNLLFTTVLSMAASLWRDSTLAKLEKQRQSEGGESIQCDKEARPMPWMSYLFWFVRDILTTAGTFVLPQRVSRALEANGMAAAKANTAAQFLCPAGMQYLTLPWHLLALDVFNFPYALRVDRMRRLGKQYLSLTSIRVVRGFCSGGIGGECNKRCLALLSG